MSSMLMFVQAAPDLDSNQRKVESDLVQLSEYAILSRMDIMRFSQARLMSNGLRFLLILVISLLGLEHAQTFTQLFPNTKEIKLIRFLRNPVNQTSSMHLVMDFELSPMQENVILELYQKYLRRLSLMLYIH